MILNTPVTARHPSPPLRPFQNRSVGWLWPSPASWPSPQSEFAEYPPELFVVVVIQEKKSLSKTLSCRFLNKHSTNNNVIIMYKNNTNCSLNMALPVVSFLRTSPGFSDDPGGSRFFAWGLDGILPLRFIPRGSPFCRWPECPRFTGTASLVSSLFLLVFIHHNHTVFWKSPHSVFYSMRIYIYIYHVRNIKEVHQTGKVRKDVHPRHWKCFSSCNQISASSKKISHGIS